jgi:hypothetical protein
MAIKLKWQFGESEEKLENEVNNIVGNTTIEQLLSQLPSEISCSNEQTAQLQIKKLGNIVWQVGYAVYKEPRLKDFEKSSVIYTTEPSLKLALFEMLEELKKGGI